MEKYGTYLRIVLTAILIFLPLSYAILRIVQKTKKVWQKTKDLIQESYNNQQIKKELKEKKESIINPKIENPDADEDFQEVIETAIAEAEEEKGEQEGFPTWEKKSDKSDEKPTQKKEEKQASENKSAEIPWTETPQPNSLKSSEWILWNSTKIDEKTKKQLDRILVEANFLKNEGKFEEYEKKIIEGLALDPSNLELTKMLADLYFTLGSHKKALSLLKKIVERDPEDHKSLRQIGEIYFINGDNETAELLVEKAIHLKPDSPKYNLSLVEIYYNTERVNDAIACMEKIIKLRPANTNYLLTLAELYEEIKDVANAKKYYFSILEYEPSNDKAKKKLKQYSE